MIVYQQGFDIYHTIYRIINLLGKFNYSDSIELDRLRIWDYYLLYPNKMKSISLKNSEKDIKLIINNFIDRKDNPYELILDDRKMLEKLKPIQIGALKYLASIGLINKDFSSINRISKISEDVLIKLNKISEKPTVVEENTISLLVGHFYHIPLNGNDGLKKRTKLLENKYDV
ncbi:ABC-three component system middle component 5 [Myroides odoratus]